MKREKAAVAVILPPGRKTGLGQEDLDELIGLTDSAGAQVVKGELIRPREMHPETLIGRGRAERLGEEAKEAGATLLVLDAGLSPRQHSWLEQTTGLRVVDRIEVILDIFSQRARSKDGKLQVELARLRHLFPRIRGKGKEMSRLGGGIGTRGPGETYLETRQRLIGQRISHLKEMLERSVKQRGVMAAGRRKDLIPQAALIGYTNAGKSTLFNRLSGAGTSAKDRLFDTLDPLVRRIASPSGRGFILSDTVGFIRRLPPDLLASFRSTLDEAYQADLLVIVADASSVELETHLGEVRAILEALELQEKPRLLLLNKVDRIESGERDRLLLHHPEAVALSAATGDGVEVASSAIEARLFSRWRRWEVRVSSDQGEEWEALTATGKVIAVRREGERLVVTLESPFADNEEDGGA
jgi:GTP-binding protein HflX